MTQYFKRKTSNVKLTSLVSLKSLFSLLSLILIFVSINVNAQQYPFIKYNQSKLIFGKDSSQFMNFYKKIDELREGKRNKVTVIHFGGSHIQAGFWTEVLMDGFQKTGNFKGGGTFIFPFKIVNTNSPHFFKSFTTGKWIRKRSALAKEMCDNLGLAGMAGITNDSANTFGFKLLKNNHHQSFNTLRVYHNFNPNFEFFMDEQSGLQFTRRDFKKESYTEYHFETYIDSVNFNLVRKDTIIKDFMLRGFSIENSNPGFYYASIGVNGASTSSYLKCQEFVNELTGIPPDLVIFSLGVNDTHDANFSKQKFIENYDSLVALVKIASPNCTFLFTTVTDNYMNRKTANKRPIKAQEAMFELMEKHNAAVYDLYDVMGGYKSIYKWYKAGLAAKDKVHFNGRGYNILANLMFDAIDRSYRYNSKIK
jgi:lysophospholipase L1-like esterase